MPATIELLVNGTRREGIEAGDRTLLSVLREDLGLTGAKYGCGEGMCGACTVHVDGRPIRSCLMRASAAAGKKILTIEGLAGKPRRTSEGTVEDLHPVQAAFIKHGAMQCGYCTPGMIMSAVAVVKQAPNATDEEIKQMMEGNVCRCGTYPRVLSAIKDAAAKMKGGDG
jgi:aerobic-type carbon monoxide dehydrogenase small subunit (CoxS/CutS family)